MEGAPAEPEVPTISKTDAEWRKELGPEKFRILRKKGTQAAGTGEVRTSLPLCLRRWRAY